jgi:oxygen-dependent protoporphyrinogen oxidase
MKSVAIIGAGVTGLTAAFYLRRRGVAVTVFEAGNRAGGVIQSVRRNGFLAECGPNTLLETSPQISQLVRDAGLQARRLDPVPQADARFLVRDGRVLEMPASVPGFLTTKLFSWRGKLAFLREPFVSPRRDGVEESIAQFVTRRFSQEFLDHAIDALVGGIYAGDPQKLSVTYAFPRLKALEDNYGSMVKGQIFGARARKKSGEVARDRAPKFSFDEGLQVLTDTLTAQLGDSLKLNSPVTVLEKTEPGWRVTARGETTAHDAVIFCGTARGLVELKFDAGRAALPRSLGGTTEASRQRRSTTVDVSLFSEIKHPPVASVVLGFRRADVAHPCAGFGMLIPKIAGYKILGTIFSSSLFPNRAPDGHVLLTSYVGGERYPELASLPEAQLREVVLADLRALLGVRGAPVFAHHTVYSRAIPQYNVGYGRFKAALAELEQRAPDFFVAGHFRDGVSLSDCIVAGANVAERVGKTF